MGKKQIPVVPWFTFPSDKPQLIGTECKTCGHHFFPQVTMCRNPECRSKEVEEYLLSRTGKVWSFVVQEAAPPPPFLARDPWTPYVLAEVKFPEGIKVMGMVSPEIPFDSIQIGMEMETVVGKFYDDDEGNEVMTWKFRPTSA